MRVRSTPLASMVKRRRFVEFLLDHGSFWECHTRIRRWNFLAFSPWLPTSSSNSAMASPNFDASEARRFASVDLWNVSTSVSSVESVVRKNASYKSMSLLQNSCVPQLRCEVFDAFLRRFASPLKHLGHVAPPIQEYWQRSPPAQRRHRVRYACAPWWPLVHREASSDRHERLEAAP